METEFRERTMNTLFSEIKNFIVDGKLEEGKEEEIKSSFIAAEKLCESLLGATLKIRERKFIIRMLEIYYGSAGDYLHDWYRNRFVYKKSKYKTQSAVQSEKGFKIYLSSPNTNDSYTRLDIVVGDEGVAISFLLRSVLDEKFIPIGNKKNGSPNIVLKAMGINGNDHGVEIKIGSDLENDISIELTHDKIYAERKLQTVSRLRILSKKNEHANDFEKNNELKWNFCAE